MNETHNNTNTRPPVHRETGLQGLNVGNLIVDASRIGPAPTRAREALVVVVFLVLVGVVLGILQPGVASAAVAGAVLVGLFAIRWAVGTRKWGQR
jgi:hypothetical protein